MESDLHVLAEHAARTLPDSMAERKKVLRSLNRVMGSKHPALPIVRAKLAALAAEEKLQGELLLRFKQAREAQQPPHNGKDGQ